MGADSAFWITPKGQIIEPAMYHIMTIVKFPEKFGETKSSLEKTFDKFHEPMNSNVEGKAREEVMERVIKRGFIRIRLGGSGANQKWSVQLNKLTRNASDSLWSWAKQISDKNSSNDKYADVVIHQAYNNKMTKTSLDVISSGGTIKEGFVFPYIIKECDVGYMVDDFYSDDIISSVINKYIKRCDV